MFSNILFRFIVTLVILHNLLEVDSKDTKKLTQGHEQRLANGTKSCSRMGMYCDSCTDVVMCIETEWGWTEQHVQTCDPMETCLKGNCTIGKNIICDGTTNITFQCHSPGIFPDPFDCQSYHLCVLDIDSNNTKPTLKDFKHTCGPYYRYDSKSTYCKYRIAGNSCPSLPVPICRYPGHTEALEENDSIFFVCEEFEDILYPHLYACPHGEQYVASWKSCGEYETTTFPWTTGRPTYQPTYTTGRPTYQPTYTTGRPTYQPTYTTGRPTYQPTYTTGRPTYQPTYTTGRPTYQPTWATDQPATDRPTDRPTDRSTD